MMSLTFPAPSAASLTTVAKLSIIVPVYNEEVELPRLVKLFLASPCPIEREWIFVDDHSTDASLSVLKSQAVVHHFKVIEQETNQGKGAAVIHDDVQIRSWDGSRLAKDAACPRIEVAIRVIATRPASGELFQQEEEKC